MRQFSFLIFRAAICALAGLISILAIWAMAGEIISPRLIYFPTTQSEAEILYSVRGSAAAAAEVSMVRGDLWTAAAITKVAPLLVAPTGSESEKAVQADIETVREIAERAARHSPHDSRNWLVLAGLDTRLGGKGRKAGEILKLSYYTGPNEFTLMPLRLLLAAQSDAMSDEELQNLASLELQRIVVQRPDLKPAIALAYKNSRSKGREVIEATLEQADPRFLATLAAPSR